MQRFRRTALPEGVPAEGLKILRAESERDLERQFAEHAEDGYVPAQAIEFNAEYDEETGEWHTLYMLPLWKVGAGAVGEEEEMYR